MDKTDRLLIAALAGNVRRPTAELAQAAGVTAATARRRLARLREQGLLQLGPVVDLHAAGYEYLLIIGIKVEGRSPLLVAQQVAALSAALTVNVVVGAYDVELVAIAKNREQVSALLADELPAIEGVAHIDPALALEVWKFQQPVAAASESVPSEKRPLLDALDLAIVDQLALDVRQSNRAIANVLAVSESAVRSRIKRMQTQKQLCLANPYPMPSGKVNDAFVGIRVAGGKSADVCRALCAIDEVSFVCTALGRHDIICCLHVTELHSLTEVLHQKIMAIAGVKSTDPSHCVEQLKHQSLLGLVV